MGVALSSLYGIAVEDDTMKIQEINRKLSAEDRRKILDFVAETKEIDEKIAALPRGRERSKLMLRRLRLQEQANALLQDVCEQLGTTIASLTGSR